MSISSGSNADISDNGSDGEFARLANDADSVITETSTTSNRGNSSRRSEPFRSTRNSEHTQYRSNRESSPSELNTKRDYLVKLKDLSSRGVNLTSTDWDMNTPTEDLILEYKRHTKSLRRKSHLSMSKNALMMFIRGMEMVSTTDPLGIDVDLDGWSDNVNPDEFDETLEELLEKWTTDAAVAPEFKLIAALVSSAGVVAFSNRMHGGTKRKRKSKNVNRTRTPSIASSVSSLSDEDDEIREPDFSSYHNVLKTNKPHSKPVVKFSTPPPNIKSQTPDSESGDSSDEEIILPTSNNKTYSSSEESDSGESSDSDSEPETQTTSLSELRVSAPAIPVTPAKRGRGRPKGSTNSRSVTGRGRGRGGKKVINI